MNLTSLNSVTEFINSNEMCILFINNSNNTCGACNVLYGKLKKLVLDNSEIQLGLIIDNPELANYLNVFSTPFTIMYIRGLEVFREGVYTSIDEIKKIIHRFNELK